MASRGKRLRIPAGLAVVLLAPGLSCAGSSPTTCTCSYLGLADGGSIPDGGLPDASVGEVVPCSSENEADPLWNCTGFV
jgi:hypothetical protein